jgi:glycine hydroxymethyltransferase
MISSTSAKGRAEIFDFGGWKMSEIMTLIKNHEKMRNNGINLMASENYLSASVREALASDLAGRYHSYWYGGVEYAAKIIKTTEDLARRAFGCDYAIVTSLSGNMCDLAALFAFSEPGDSVAMMTLDAGGYPFGVEKFHRKLLQLPADPYSYQLRFQEAVEMIIENKAKLTILGPSFISFPHPVKELSESIKGRSTFVYDGSHTLGLMACGEFQDPLKEGAEVLMGSTHKSLFGPQGGMVLTNSEEHFKKLDEMLGFDVDEGIGLVDNPHVNRIAALGLALEELLEDQGYAGRVVANAKALAQALEGNGVPVKFKDREYTESHQIFLDMKFEDAQILCHRMEPYGIFMDIAGRIGVAEITHRGMKTSHMDFIARAISDLYHDRAEDGLKSEIKEFTAQFLK